MQPRPVAPVDIAYWGPLKPFVVEYAPDDDTFQACPAIQTIDSQGLMETVVRVPWTLSPEELEGLANGGTLWLSTFGGLPPHALHVQYSCETIFDGEVV
jgi:hypothetical protein